MNLYNPHRCSSYNEMLRQPDSDSSEQQGFYKPALRVESSNEDAPNPKPDPLLVTVGNELVICERPTDYRPRTLITTPLQLPLTCPQDYSSCTQGEPLITERRQKLKHPKFLSLKQKYVNNALYRLVYNKHPEGDFGTYIFSLNHTTDYNPKDYTLPSPLPSSSPFQSRFQSGNLLSAYLCVQSRCEEYELLLQNDTNSNGYNQWFFFSFRKEQKGTVRFSIVNLVKKHSMMEEGVRPVGCFVREGVWQPVGRDQDYQKSYVARQGATRTSKSYYTLSFTIDFEQPDTIYLALNYPYTYSRLTLFLDNYLQTPPEIQATRHLLCHSISNNPIPYLRLKHTHYQGNRKIILLARQHPGETVGSFVLEGLLTALLNQDKLLRTHEVIAIPMVNVDGVIYGNFRTNLAGFDLNRQWAQPNRYLHPQIFYLSRFIKGLEGVCFVLDCHGHSKKLNSFIYACTGEQPEPYRLFPYICGKLCPYFSLPDCAFTLTADKERTARVQLFRHLRHPNVFTLESSFFGHHSPPLRSRSTPHDLLALGHALATALRSYLTTRKELQQFEKEVREKEYLFEQWAITNREDVDSESNPSEDELSAVERKEKVLASRDRKKQKHRGNKGKKRRAREPSVQIKMVEGTIQVESKVEKEATSEQVIRVTPQDDRIFRATITETLHKKKTDIKHLLAIQEKQEKEREGKSKLRKVEKTITVVQPLAPKPPKPPLIPVLPPQKPKKQPKPTPKPQAVASNLLNRTTYFQLQQQIQTRSTRSNLHQKTQSLQISNIRKEIFFPKGNTMDVLRKLIATEAPPPPPPLDPPKPKHKEKLYVIRESKIVHSITREEEIKKSMEAEISNRTEALRNCQRKMREMSMEEPILPAADSLTLPLTPNPRPFNFPHLWQTHSPF